MTNYDRARSRWLSKETEYLKKIDRLREALDRIRIWAEARWEATVVRQIVDEALAGNVGPQIPSTVSDRAEPTRPCTGSAYGCRCEGALPAHHIQTDPLLPDSGTDAIVRAAVALVRSGYDGPFMGEAVVPLFYAVKAYEVTDEEVDGDSGEPAEAPPVCTTCNDTHQMLLTRNGHADGLVMCTRCPKPCLGCAQGPGFGPFCAHTPCDCMCHARSRIEPR